MSNRIGRPAKAETEPKQPATLVDLLRHRAAMKPGHGGYWFLPDAGSHPVQMTYVDLDRRARALAAVLQREGAAREPAVLLYPPGLEFVAAYFGCLFAGAVAVPAYPPDPLRLHSTLPRLSAIVRSCGARRILTTTAFAPLLDKLRRQAKELSNADWIISDDISGAEALHWTPPDIRGDTVAFLQYTSGSTESPRGVAITHANLIANLQAIYVAFQATQDTRLLSWLPQYHDLGLIGGVLEPLFANIPVTLMSPLSFLQDPRCWLEAISALGATCSGGPNFAFDFCVRRIPPERRKGLDLSRWKIAFTAGEPIHPDTLDRFSRAFTPCGFHSEAFRACYGLAEATLLVTTGAEGKSPQRLSVDPVPLRRGRICEVDQGHVLVSSGRPLPLHEVRIVSPHTAQPCPQGQVGEIWVRGPSVASAYYGRYALSRRTFDARPTDSDTTSFLRTGDLGFMHGDELFVVGRLKDLVIVRGSNYHPQDIEATVTATNPALRPGGCAAFAIDVDAEERLAIVCEIDTRDSPDLAAVRADILRSVGRAHSLRIEKLLFVSPKTLPKTSSGKLQRFAVRKAFLAGELPPLSREESTRSARSA